MQVPRHIPSLMTLISIWQIPPPEHSVPRHPERTPAVRIFGVHITRPQSLLLDPPSTAGANNGPCPDLPALRPARLCAGPLGGSRAVTRTDSDLLSVCCRHQPPRPKRKPRGGRRKPPPTPPPPPPADPPASWSFRGHAAERCRDCVLQLPLGVCTHRLPADNRPEPAGSVLPP